MRHVEARMGRLRRAGMILFALGALASCGAQGSRRRGAAAPRPPAFETRLVIESPATLRLERTTVCTSQARPLAELVTSRLSDAGVSVLDKAAGPDDVTVELILDVKRGRRQDQAIALIKKDGEELERFEIAGVITGNDRDPRGCGAFVKRASGELSRNIRGWLPRAKQSIAGLEAKRAEQREKMAEAQRAEEKARAEAEALAQRQREEKERACGELQAYAEKGDMVRLDQLSTACPEQVSDNQKQWLADHKREQKLAAEYAQAMDGTSQQMSAFYHKHYESGDPRVEEVRKAALKKFGPQNPALFKAAAKRIARMSTRSFSTGLCDLKDDTAYASLEFTFEGAAAGALGFFLGGDQSMRNLNKLAQAREQSEKAVIAEVKRATGAKKVVLQCRGNHWYINDRPWPPKKPKAKDAKKEPAR